MRAFTLIEVLAVVTLLSLAATAGLVSLAAASTQARLEAAAAIVIDADAQSRLLARSGSAATMEVRDGRVVVASDPERFARDLPDGTNVTLASPGRRTPLTSIRFDRLGSSADYWVIVAVDDRAHRWLVAGSTGWVRPDPGEATE